MDQTIGDVRAEAARREVPNAFVEAVTLRTHERLASSAEKSSRAQEARCQESNGLRGNFFQAAIEKHEAM
jgi:hypothetical protein